MEAIAEILEQELEDAFEVKDKKSLHRYVILLTENLVKKETFEKEQNSIRSEIKELTQVVKLGFERMDERFEHVDKRFEQVDKRFEQVDKRFEQVDKRFEQVDKRFEDMHKKFTMMFTFMNLGMGIVILVTMLVKFLG
ncbi:MAG: hypothetical protein DRP59_06885 [Spirochaetes bacterium]|nr:MAG: hypothetical protein DRP59_06885 [Spirochaetota bacterium]